MKIKTFVYNSDKTEMIKDLVAWESGFNSEVEQTVASIIQRIRNQGDKALIELTKQFDKNSVAQASQLRLSPMQLKNAWQSITDEQRQALELAKQRIGFYAEHQKLENWEIKEADGSMLGQKITAVDSVGLYVPGGQAAYPSSVLMNAIPAKVAGVKRLVMVSPATLGELNTLVLAAAYLCEIDEYYMVGGAQAVAALAYGTESISPVDLIVGPGNIYVATAKKHVFGKVAIDMIAGPSEVAIIYDGCCDPQWVAADLFAQAEHDANAQSILITTKKEYAESVEAAMQALLEKMPRQSIIKQSIENRGAIILVNDIDEAIAVSNLIAPEHLELLTDNPTKVAEGIKHAGAIFIGAHSCEVLGDYIAGPNHVLPTSGSARFSSPLGVYDFQKRSSVVKLTPETASDLAKHARILAESEGLYAHAQSAIYRINDEF